MIELLPPRMLLTVIFVAPTGVDSAPGTIDQPLASIQHALDLASHPGDSVEVRAGTYSEHLTMNHSGSTAGYITLESYKGEHVVLTGVGAVPNDTGFGNNMIQIVDQSYLQISGLDIGHDSGIVDDAFGIRVQGAGSHIVIKNNKIHDITGKVLSRSGGNVSGHGGAGIHVYGSSLTHPYSDITIKGNAIYDCQPGDSETETVTINGNVDGFLISHNRVHDSNNIGIDMIGGEADVFSVAAGTKGLPVARNGRCVGNRVYNIHANYGGGFAAGIYVDGAQHVLIDRNISDQNDMGMEIGAENAGYVASGIIVQNNILYRNTQAGLAIGGYAADKGRVTGCRVVNNTVFDNDATLTGSGQLDIQYASNNSFTNNIFAATGSETLIGSDGAGNTANALDFNLYDAPIAAFAWNADSYTTFTAFQHATGQDVHSLFADPRFADSANASFALRSDSPAIGRGTSKMHWFSILNFTGARRALPPNIGAY